MRTVRLLQLLRPQEWPVGERASLRAVVARRSVLALLLLPVGSVALAQWNGSTIGRIHTIEVTALTNYPVRVALQCRPALCTAGHTWAYVDGGNSNYKVMVAALLAANARASQVTLYTVHDASGMNYCRIEHLAATD